MTTTLKSLSHQQQENDNTDSSESMRLAVQRIWKEDTQQSFADRLQQFLETFQVRTW